VIALPVQVIVMDRPQSISSRELIAATELLWTSSA
jgi:hypothetical protein